MSQCNSYISIYKTVHEQLPALESCSTPADLFFTANLKLILEDHRRENLPTASEVAAIIPDIGPDWHQQGFRDMILTLQSDEPGERGLKKIDPAMLLI